MTSFAAIRERTAELQKQIKALQSEAAEQIKPLLQQFLVDNPQVEAIRWTQYTPYFNDGDTCTFRVNDPMFKFVGASEDDGDYGDGFLSVPSNYGADYNADFRAACSRELFEKCRELERELGGLEDVLYALFDDHVQVTVTRDGVDVEEYDHD